MPSASRMTARFSRSAFICRVMALTMSCGGRMSRSSTRVIFTPQDSVAWSTTDSSLALISSRFDRVSSRSIEPITVRKLVVESAVIAL